MNMLFFLTGKVCMFFFFDFTANNRPSHLMTNINGGLIRLEIHPAAIVVVHLDSLLKFAAQLLSFSPGVLRRDCVNRLSRILTHSANG